MHIGQGADISRRLQNARWTDSTHQTKVFPDKQAAALIMQPLMQKYNIQPDGGIEAQTVATDQWLQEQDMSAQADAASMTLGIRESIRQLKTLNDEIQHLTAVRNDERAQRSTAASSRPTRRP